LTQGSRQRLQVCLRLLASSGQALGPLGRVILALQLLWWTTTSVQR
jgi:hypothetical protein